MPKLIRHSLPADTRGRRLSMRWWLGAAFAVVGIVTAASVYVFVTDSSERVISERSTEIAVGRTVRVANRLGSARERATRELLARNRAESYAAWAFDRDGELISSPEVAGGNVFELGQREEAIQLALTGGRYLADELPHNVTIVAVPVFRDGKVDGALLARATRPQALQRSADNLKGDSLTALVIAVVVGILVGFLVAWLISRRIKRLAESAGHMAVGRFDIPLHLGAWRDEIGDLAQALDLMREALRESFNVLSSERDKLSAIFAGLTDAVIVYGVEGTLRFSNPAAERLISDGDPVPELMPLVRRAAEKGQASADTLRVGEQVYAVQVRDLPAEQAVLTVVRDRTEELRREMAEREFVSNAAHELRNPIAGISSSIEVLQAGAVEDPHARGSFLERLADDAERLKRITQSLLTMARLEATGEAEVDVLDVAVVLEEAASVLDLPEGVALDVEPPDDLAASGDPVLLRQVLVGLISNAYRHTPPPGRVTLRARQNGNREVLIEVEDTGAGIPADELDRVFERFYRGRKARDQEGFGLGLAIAKRMVDLMDGEIGVTSRVGQGSTFWVKLPTPKPSSAPVP